MPVVGPAFHQGPPGGPMHHAGGYPGYPHQMPRNPYPNGGGPTVPMPQPSIQPMTMHDQAEAARLAQDYEALVNIIKQWNANRLDLFALTLPNEVRHTLSYSN